MALLNESIRSWRPHEAYHDILLRISRGDINVDDEWGSFLTAVCTTVLVVSMVSTFYWVLWKPYSKRRFYEKQGISGPVFRPFIGNLPEIRELRRGVPTLGGQISESPARRVGTELFVFSEKYGKVSVFEQGSMTRIILADVNLVKDVLLSKAGCYKRSVLTAEVISAIAGHGSILTAEGGNWKQKNQIMSPAFRHTFLKGLFHHIVERGDNLVTQWQKAINNGADIKQGAAEVAVDLDVPETLLDIIIRTTFGFTSCIEGGDIYAVHDAVNFMTGVAGNRQRGYARLIPGYSFFPTATNINFWIKKRAIVKFLKNIVSARMKVANDLKGSSIIAKAGSRQSVYGSDILGMMLEAMKEGNSNMTASQVLDECAVFFLATDSSTSLLLMWSLLLLAQNPDWQQRARSEVQEVLGAEATPEVDNLAKLKLIDMILNETLRLYPPVTAINRDASELHQLGSVTIAPGTNVILPMSVLNQSKEIWGQDAHLFKPDRWDVKNLHTNGKNSTADGLDAATAATANSVNSLNNFMPFGGGNRMCLGRNLARMAVKLLLSMLLRRFSFSVSPSYCHAPGHGGNNLWPQFGIQLLIKNVENSEVTSTN